MCQRGKGTVIETIKTKHLSGLGNMNYRNISIAYVVAMLNVMNGEVEHLPTHAKVRRAIQKASDSMMELFNLLPDQMTEDEVKTAANMFNLLDVALVAHKKKFGNLCSSCAHGPKRKVKGTCTECKDEIESYTDSYHPKWERRIDVTTIQVGDGTEHLQCV